MQGSLSTLIFSPVFNSEVSILFPYLFTRFFVTFEFSMQHATHNASFLSFLCGLGAQRRAMAILSVVSPWPTIAAHPLIVVIVQEENFL